MTEAVQQSDAPAPQWKLLVSNALGIQETYFVTGQVVTIGRELDNDIALDDLNVSRYHARLTLKDKNLLVEDLDSSNGTAINDVAITGSRPLQADDAIKVGTFTIKVHEFSAKVRGSSARSRSKTESNVTSPASAPSLSRKQPRRRYLLAVVAAMFFAVVLLLCVVAVQWIIAGNVPVLSSDKKPNPATVALNAPTIVINQAPIENGQVQTHHSVSVQAIASDPLGISRMELWVNDKRVDRVESPLEQSAGSMTAIFQWAADTAGTYTIDIRAYNEAGQMAIARVATLTAAGNTPVPTPIPPTVTPSATITPIPPPPAPTFTPQPLPQPTATPPEPTATPVSPTPSPTQKLALLSVNVPLLNVRSGPGTEYGQVGQMQQGEETAIVGQADGWWKINLETAPNGQGWVFGNPNFVTVENVGNVPVAMVPLPPTPASPGTPTSTPVFTPTPTRPPATVIRAPAGKTLLIIRNRSIINQPARLTLSGGKSVGGGKELDPPPNGQLEIVLKPDFYRALWSAPWNSFTRGADFDAVPGKVMVMTIVPEDGLTNTEFLDELVIEVAPSPTPAPLPPTPLPGEPIAAPGKALFVVSNRSAQNEYARLTITGGNYGGGTEFTLDGNTQTQLEMHPGDYRTIWNSPAGRGVNAGREFTVTAGEVIQGWIIPETGQVFMQFPGQETIQINN